MQLSWALVVVIGLAAVGGSVAGKLTQEFKKEFHTFRKSGVRSDKFNEITSLLALPNDVRNAYWRNGSLKQYRDELVCEVCYAAVGTLLDAYVSGMELQEIRDIMVTLCEVFNIQTDRVCEGVVDSNLDAWAYILENTENLNEDRLCSVFQQSSNCGLDDSPEWSVDLGEPKSSGSTSKTKQSGVKADPINILQLTDIHFDPNYLVGGNAECDEPMCCRWDQGEPATPEAAAGRWGDYRSCDIPWEVVTDAMTHTSNIHQIDYIYMTGDIIDHGVWDTSFVRNNESLSRIYNEFKRSYGDIPVFPSIGNHEMHPMNVFAPVRVTQENISAMWLYEILADLWSVWLPTETRETILKGGYYTALVRPGFRVISLNNNQCYTNNFWLVHDGQDPDGQLQWLIEVLQQAEIDGETVHMLYHIPTGSNDCYRRWSREYNRIIDRFENTVAAQFSGHTHNDEFHIFYSNDEPKRANNVLWTGGSLTSYSDVNGNYRLYSVDGDTLEVLDHETWIYNMTASNLSPDDTLTWIKMYSFKEAYGMTSLTPVELDSLAQRMATDEDLLQQYFRFYNLLGDPKLAEGCDTECLEKHLCGIVTSDSSDKSRCDELIGTFRANRLKN